MADSPQSYGGNIPWGSNVVAGQLVPQAPTQAFNPLAYGPVYTGPAYWPRQGVYSVPPVVGNAGMATQGSPYSGGDNSVASTGSLPTSSSERGNPFHPTKSPLVFALVFLVGGYLMLHHIHYK